MKQILFLLIGLLLPEVAGAEVRNEGTRVSAVADATHEAIDLGLSSGTKWATCNVGATHPEEYGGYYAWGDVVEKDYYSTSNYSRYDQVDLTPEEDVAIAEWGAEWRMPTMDEINELLTECNWSWEELEGVMGARVTGPNGQSIFLPASGFKDFNDSYAPSPGIYGSYWGRTHAKSRDYATELVFGVGHYKNYYRPCDFYYEFGPTGVRHAGRSVRPVYNERRITGNDYTIYITNPTYELNFYGGWDGTILSGVDPDNNAEHFNKNYNTYQTLKGLPPGSYILGVQGFYRRGLSDNDYALWQAGDTESSHALLYASSSEGDFSIPLVSPSSAALPESLGGSIVTVGDGLYIPSSMIAAAAWFNAGYYHNYLNVVVGEDGLLTIGIKKEVTLSSDWTCIDNWTLFRTNNETETAQLCLFDRHELNSNSVVVGNNYNYAVGVENKSNSPWTGTLWLKDGNSNVHYWTASIAAGGARYFYYSNYSPSTAGQKSLALYYQTANTGAVKLVDSGNLQNPLTINAKGDATASLQLCEAISSEPSIHVYGASASYTATVQNTGDEDWTGTLAITADGAPLSGEDVTITSGGQHTITHSWYPTSTGEHTIGVAYKNSEEGSSWQTVPCGDHTNPIAVTVTNANELGDVQMASITHLTNDVVPSEVTPGTLVNCFYKIFIADGTPVPGVSAVFSVAGSSTRDEIVTALSDADGIAQLTIETEGEDAIAYRGQTARLTCIGLRDANGREIELVQCIPDLELTVHDGTIFQNIEKVKLGAEVGLSGNADLADFAKLNVGGSIPISIAWTYDEHGKVKDYTLATGLKLEASASLGWESDKMTSDKMQWFKCLNGSAGINLGARCSWTFDAQHKKDAAVQFVVNACDSYTNGTDKDENIGVCVIEEWANKRRNYSANWSFFFGGFASAGINFVNLSKLPVKKGALKNGASALSSSSIHLKDATLSGKYAVDWEPWKYKTDYYGNMSYGEAISVTLTGEAKASSSIGVRKFMKNHKTWFKGVDIEKYWDTKLKNYLIFKKGNVSRDFSLTTKEEEFYTTSEKTTLSEISHTIKHSSGWNFSLDDWRLKLFKFAPFNVEASYTNTNSLKVTSKGAWAAYLQKQNADVVRNIFPAVKAKSLISPFNEIDGAYELDFGVALADLARKASNPSKYDLKESLKVEQSNSSEAKLKVSFHVFDWGLFKFNLNLGASIETECYPTESYFSVADRRFFPVVVRPATALDDIVESLTGLGDNIEEGFGEHKNELMSYWEKYSSKVGAGAVADMPEQVVFTNEGLSRPLFAQGVPNRVRRRHPLLAATQQQDISTFRFTIRGKECFDGDTELSHYHHYPAGDLLAVTDKNDTLFVVSDVYNVVAEQGGELLAKAPYGTFLLETHAGADDLTPFGLPASLPLDIYHSDIDSNIWHYVGPAGTPIVVDSLGSYILATSIKNDTQAPELSIQLDETTGVLSVGIKENIGLMGKTLLLMINGEYREPIALDDSHYALQLTDEEMNYRINTYASIYDLAGNKGEMSTIFNVNKPENDTPDVLLGDVNGDGIVNVSDVTAIISHILGKNPAMFNKQAADVSGDGLINVTDVTGTINIILNK